MGHEVLLVSREGWVHAQHQISVTHLLPTTHSRCTMIWKWHLNSPRHNINYADSMAKAKADSAPGSALGGHHGSMHSGGSIGENLNSYSIPMLNMFLQTLQPPAQNCREAITCGTKSAKKISSSHRHRSGSAAAGGRGGSTESATGKKRPSFSSATGTAEPDEAMTAER